MDVAFHSGISAVKSGELNSEKNETTNATSPWPNSSIGKKLNDCPLTGSCEIVEES